MKKAPPDTMDKIDYRFIDIKLRKLIKLMNEVPEIKTLFSCQGHPAKDKIDHSYVMFTVDSPEILKEVSKLFLWKGCSVDNLINAAYYEPYYHTEDVKFIRNIFQTGLHMEIAVQPNDTTRLCYVVHDDHYGGVLRKDVEDFEEKFEEYIKLRDLRNSMDLIYY